VTLRCFPAVLYSSSVRDQEDLKEYGDPSRKQLLSSGLLISAVDFRCMLAWCGE
jgi:hypothetical protein